jgi:hypothetical protein
VPGALLKLADLPVPAAAAANPASDLPDRIAQLEGRPSARRAALGWWSAGATVANLCGSAAAATCAQTWVSRWREGWREPVLRRPDDGRRLG